MVAVSADANTAIVRVSLDSNGAGAAWVFNSSSGVSSQQRPKLVGHWRDWRCRARQVGRGPLGDEIGAAWLFTRSDAVWSQLQKLVSGEANFPQAFFGGSVALSADGRTALVGAPGVVNGGSFVFIAPSRWATDNGDGKSDIVWRDTGSDANNGSTAV